MDSLANKEIPLAANCPKCGFSYCWNGKACTHCKFEIATSLVAKADVIRFDCPSCSKRIKAPAIAAGKKGSCPACSVRVAIPVAIAPVSEEVDFLIEAPSLVPAPAQAPTVPIKVTFPKVGGGVETQVSQQTAEICAYIAVGGVLVLAGVALWVLCPPAAPALTTVAAGAASKGRVG
jgi:hypothetical protein